MSLLPNIAYTCNFFVIKCFWREHLAMGVILACGSTIVLDMYGKRYGKWCLNFDAKENLKDVLKYMYKDQCL